jgi:phosphoribosylglycinamide formyltransferase-1
MRLGIVVSSGGSAFEEVVRITSRHGVRFSVITDRPCGAEAAAQRVGAEQIRIAEESRERFSRKVADAFAERSVGRALLFLDRLVSAELFEAVPTYNIHPAALPAFPGRTGVEDAHAARVRILGCTLHQVDATVDGGPIVCQIARGVDPDWPIARWQKLAFLMKVYCGLVWVRLSAEFPSGEPPMNASHGLPPSWMKAFLELQEREGQAVITP